MGGGVGSFLMSLNSFHLAHPTERMYATRQYHVTHYPYSWMSMSKISETVYIHTTHVHEYNLNAHLMMSK